jgi:hypothetical protein
VWDNPYDTKNPLTEPASLKNGLVAYYPFNGNANDESGNGNNGITNEVKITFDRFNSIGKAYNFNGQTSHIRGSKLVKSMYNSFSYSFWAKPEFSIIIPPESQSSDAASNLNSNPCVIHPIHGSSFGDFNIVAGSGIYLGMNGIYVQEHSGGWEAVSLSFTANLTGWHHIVVNYENRLSSIYIDGKFIKSGVISTRNIFGSLGPDNFSAYSNSGIGAGYSTGGTNPQKTAQFYKGDLDDFRFYNRALTQEEITYLANN